MMRNYVILSDSACDIPQKLLDEWKVRICTLSHRYDDGTEERGVASSADFYRRMREGCVVKTSAVNAAEFHALFEDELKKGNDVLYLGFSSGLSTTVNSASVAADELRPLYPEAKIVVVDTLCASGGFGLLLYLTVQKRDEGATLEEAAQFAEDTKLHLCHWFTVDDLVYLKRGGRVSAAAAFVGGVLGIKPVLHVDNDGHLINMFKVRGRRASLKALADKYGELALKPGEGPIYISHGDCMDDVNTLREMLQEGYGAKVDLVVDVSPVIGAHSGPGTMALFFLGRER